MSSTRRRHMAAALALGTAAVGSGVAMYTYQVHAADTSQNQTTTTPAERPSDATGVAPGQPGERHGRGPGTQSDTQTDGDTMQQAPGSSGQDGQRNQSTGTGQQGPGHGSSSGS